MPQKKQGRAARLVKVLVGVGLLVAVVWWPAKQLLIYQFGVSELSVGLDLVQQWLGLGATASADVPLDDWETPSAIELDESILPFRQIGDSLGPRGRGNNMLIPRGAALFDANGDDRLDLYLAHSGRPIAKRTTEDHILTDEHVPAKPCTLFLNMGNDEAGDPIFKSIQDLIAEGNRERVGAELQIENKYRPRTSIEEDEFGPGRVAWGATAADFNGDGRMDLYVTNYHRGLMSQTHQLGMRVYPGRNNLGRAARDSREPVVIRLPSFLWGDRKDGLATTVELGEKPEPEGRNSLYLNLGDQDQDGIPEWEDATERLGVGGRFASATAAVADIDRDGDLDLYVANSLDPDFWGWGDTSFAGNRNSLYINQLAETGSLGFRSAAEEYGVAGLHVEEGIDTRMWFPGREEYVDIGEQYVEGRQVGERADHSWTAMLNDWNQDGYPDLVIANDIANRLRVYENEQGKGFRYLKEFDEPVWDGCWMGMSVGDLDGDLFEEILVTSCGGQVMSVRNNALFIEDAKEANIMAVGVLNYSLGKSTLHHALLRYEPGKGLRESAPQATVEPSPYIPPDQSIAANFAAPYLHLHERFNFATSLTAYEFGFNAPMFDVDNDGDLDIYMAGSLSRGNDDFLGDWSGSPGRMFVNESSPGKFAFRDLTLEYQLLDMTHIDYASNPPRRPSPGTNWHKRDYIYITDTDGYSGSGVEASKSSIHDIFRMHEATFGVYSADLNDDGFADLVVTHAGGYNSISPDARNLKVEFGGRLLAVPAPNKVNKPPTNFEESPTFVYINSGAPRGSEGQWAKIRLIDRDSYNRYGVGARVLVNGKIMRRVEIGGGAAFGATSWDLHLGLGPEPLHSLEIVWPSGELEPQSVVLDPPVSNRRVCIDREDGVVPCEARADSTV